MIQDIAPHKYVNAYQPVPPEKTSIALIYSGRSCVVKIENEELVFPHFEEVEYLRKDFYEEYTYLFTIDEQRYYLIENVTKDELKDLAQRGFHIEKLEIFRRGEPQYRAFAGITGYQLASWYQKHRFCGNCGSRTRKDKKERMLYCDTCGNMEYPKICPATIIGVKDGNRLLLSKYAGRTFKRYALIAGYTEIGETMEETVAREVMEEVGLKVKNIQYYKSQPWSFSDTILMGFYCDLDGDDTITLDEDELACAEWFEREEIPVEPSRDSLTNEMIMMFKNGKIQ